MAGRDLGILNNRGFLSHYIAESPLTASLKFAPLNIWPIVAPYDHELLPSMAVIYSEARYQHSGINNISLRRAMVAGETLAPKIPNVKYADEQTSRASVVQWMKHGLANDSFSNLGDYTNANYQECLALPEVVEHFTVNTVPPTYNWTPEQIAAMTAKQAVFLMYYFAKYIRIPQRHLAVENIILAYCSLAYRGQVTDEFCKKIQTLTNEELGIAISLNSTTMSSLYHGYLGGVDETNAQAVMNALYAMIPDIALKLKLTLLQQASGSRLTVFIIIGRAMRLYYNFPWGRVNRLTSGEIANWNSALAAIGNNFYYGFKRDMGEARSPLYKSVGYVARELLVKLNGEHTLMRYASLGGNIRNKAALDLLIHDYVKSHLTFEGGETPEERTVLPTEQVLRTNQMFT